MCVDCRETLSECGFGGTRCPLCCGERGGEGEGEARSRNDGSHQVCVCVGGGGGKRLMRDCSFTTTRLFERRLTCTMYMLGLVLCIYKRHLQHT